MKWYSVGKDDQGEFPFYLVQWKQVTVLLDAGMPGMGGRMLRFPPYNKYRATMHRSGRRTQPRLVAYGGDAADSRPYGKAPNESVDEKAQRTKGNTPSTVSEPLGYHCKTSGYYMLREDTPLLLPPVPVGTEDVGFLDWSVIDVILISHHGAMTALPFITERTGFAGTIYATEPTLEIGWQLLEEMVEDLTGQDPTTLSAFQKRLERQGHIPSDLMHELGDLQHWQPCYTAAELRASMEKVTTVQYQQTCDIAGLVTVTPLSSGYSLGSANWWLCPSQEGEGHATDQAPRQRVLYVSASSATTSRHPTALALPPTPVSSSRAHQRVLVLTSLNRHPTSHPEAMVHALCRATAEAISRGGRVLFPLAPTGVFYDLLEILHIHLTNAGLSVPFYAVSKVAGKSLKYATILSEWMCPSKQEKVYLPQEPLYHAQLLELGQLRVFDGITDQAFTKTVLAPTLTKPDKPAAMDGGMAGDVGKGLGAGSFVLFVGHPSLRFGDVVHLLSLWRHDPTYTLILTDPDVDAKAALAPYEPMAMEVHLCPLDPRLSAKQAHDIFLQPDGSPATSSPTLLMPHTYAHRYESRLKGHALYHDHWLDLSSDPDGEEEEDNGDDRAIPAMMTEALAQRLVIPNGHCRGTTLVTRVQGILSRHNHRHILHPTPDTHDPVGVVGLGQRCLVMDHFLTSLSDAGYPHLRMSRSRLPGYTDRVTIPKCGFGLSSSSSEIGRQGSTAHVHSSLNGGDVLVETQDGRVRRWLTDLILASSTAPIV